MTVLAGSFGLVASRPESARRILSHPSRSVSVHAGSMELYTRFRFLQADTNRRRPVTCMALPSVTPTSKPYLHAAKPEDWIRALRTMVTMKTSRKILLRRMQMRKMLLLMITVMRMVAKIMLLQPDSSFDLEEDIALLASELAPGPSIQVPQASPLTRTRFQLTNSELKPRSVSGAKNSKPAGYEAGRKATSVACLTPQAQPHVPTFSLLTGLRSISVAGVHTAS